MASAMDESDDALPSDNLRDLNQQFRKCVYCFWNTYQHQASLCYHCGRSLFTANSVAPFVETARRICSSDGTVPEWAFAAMQSASGDPHEVVELMESSEAISPAPRDESAYSTTGESVSTGDGNHTESADQSLDRDASLGEEADRVSDSSSESTLVMSVESLEKVSSVESSTLLVPANASQLQRYVQHAGAEMAAPGNIPSMVTSLQLDDNNEIVSVAVPLQPEAVVAPVEECYRYQVPQFEPVADVQQLENNIAILENNIVQAILVALIREDFPLETVYAIASSIFQGTPFVGGDDADDFEDAEEIDMPDFDIQDWPAEVQQNLVDQLQIASLCVDNHCADENCIFYKELLEDIRCSLYGSIPLFPSLHFRVLRAIVNHATDCSEIFCGVPWCYFFLRRDGTVEEQIATLRRSVYAADLDDASLLLEDIDDTAENVSFITLDASVDWPSILFDYGPYPRLRLDFQLFSLELGYFGRTTAVGRALTLPPEYIHIDQYTLVEGSRLMWEQLGNAGGQHENIARHFWAICHESTVTVCLEFHAVQEGRNLRVLLNDGPLNWHTACRYMSGLVSAIQFLHRSDILYLLWAALSIYQSSDGSRLLLSDFSCAVHLPTVVDDDLVDVIREALPPHVIAPEMFPPSGEIGRHCDVWGVGCLMVEMVSGLPLYYRFRHRTREQLRNAIREVHIDDIRQRICCSFLLQIFTTRENRISMDDIAAYVNQHR